MKKTKEELKQIYNDTLRTASTIYPKGLTSKYTSKFIKPVSHYLDPKVIVEPLDSVSAVAKYGVKGNTCVLNMASAKTAGGGAADGFTAQEECLFRCSTLPNSVNQDLYPLEGDVALYTKGIIFFKDVDYQDMTPVVTDVVTVASVNLNANSTYDEKTEKFIDGIIAKPKGYYGMMTDRIRLMCTLAAENNIQYLILGAWGCGVFKNDPYEVADMFYDVLILENYADLFKQVVFAIINDENSVGDNFDVFSDMFSVDNI